MVLSTMRPKEVRKGSQIPAKGRIDVLMRVGMQNSSSSLTQKGSNGRCQKTPVTGRPVMLVRSVTAVPPEGRSAQEVNKRNAIPQAPAPDLDLH